jgi:hypothetical protein
MVVRDEEIFLGTDRGSDLRERGKPRDRLRPLEDFHLREKITHSDHERIREGGGHARRRGTRRLRVAWHRAAGDRECHADQVREAFAWALTRSGT